MRESLIHNLVARQARREPAATAILGLDGPPLSYAGLLKQMTLTAARLRELGIGRGGVIGLIAPNGPAMATAFLSLAAAATVAPLNPMYRAAEYDFYLSDLHARALIVLAGMETPARQVAARQDIPVIDLRLAQDGAAGLFSLEGEANPAPATAAPASAEAVALVLHTSGTTARPKQVPLSQANLAASASNIQETLRLAPDDRCLNVMPLFHIHGLMAAVLASMAAGASVVCTPGFSAPDFHAWLEQFRPTWYTAVPTMHQAILARAATGAASAGQRQRRRATSLRFIRSSSAALPASVLAELESTFGVPVIESYGMTEAAHQMASNPLPPRRRKPGSVGEAAGPEVAIMLEDGVDLLAAGEVGEIVIRGANVIAGYVDNPEANAAAFASGWFRTGDQGFLDAEGYLFVTGRLKELINRGGEKIAPREVDEVLLSHPAVTQAVAFAMPDDRLGEEIAAAVVVADDAVTEHELRRYSAERLAYFKVPRRIVILDEVPKGPTGKLQRIGLAAELGLAGRQTQAGAAESEFVAPRNMTESRVADLWREVLRLSDVGIHQPFLDAGGDSLLAIQLVGRIRQVWDVSLPLVDFFEAATVAEQAVLVAGHQLRQDKP